MLDYRINRAYEICQSSRAFSALRSYHKLLTICGITEKKEEMLLNTQQRINPAARKDRNDTNGHRARSLKGIRISRDLSLRFLAAHPRRIRVWLAAGETT